MGRRKVIIHSEKDVAGIKLAAQAAAWVRDRLRRTIRPGLTTLELDLRAADLIREAGGDSAFLGYRGFPGQICISLNDEVVHGIGRPDRVISPGDVVSIDVGVRLNGFIGDTATTVCVPPGDAPLSRKLLATTKESLVAGMAAARAGNYINDISTAVESVVRRAGFTVVRDFVGHGCGRELHEPPEVPNFAQSHRGPKLRPGMVLAIEPMVNSGGANVVVEDDGWTVRTTDGGLSAHFEHMALITKDKPEILTCPRTA